MTLSHHLLLLGVLSLWHCSADSADPLGVFCDKDARFGSPKESAYIDGLSVQLVLKASASGFVAASYGRDQVFVHGLAQCRGDVDKEGCSTCIQDAARQIRTRCPNEADARIWFDYCFLRYYKAIGLIPILKSVRYFLSSHYLCHLIYLYLYLIV